MACINDIVFVFMTDVLHTLARCWLLKSFLCVLLRRMTHRVMFRAFYNPDAIIKIAVITRLAGVWNLDGLKHGNKYLSALKIMPLPPGGALFSGVCATTVKCPPPPHPLPPLQISCHVQRPYTEIVCYFSITFVVLSVYRFVLSSLSTLFCACFSSSSLNFFLKKPQTLPDVFLSFPFLFFLIHFKIL